MSLIIHYNKVQNVSPLLRFWIKTRIEYINTLFLIAVCEIISVAIFETLLVSYQLISYKNTFNSSLVLTETENVLGHLDVFLLVW